MRVYVARLARRGRDHEHMWGHARQSAVRPARLRPRGASRHAHSRGRAAVTTSLLFDATPPLPAGEVLAALLADLPGHVGRPDAVGGGPARGARPAPLAAGAAAAPTLRRRLATGDLPRTSGDAAEGGPLLPNRHDLAFSGRGGRLHKEPLPPAAGSSLAPSAPRRGGQAAKNFCAASTRSVRVSMTPSGSRPWPPAG